MYLSCVYVLPNSCDTYHQNIFDYTNAQCSTLDSDVVIVGDFNALDINWSTLNATSTFSHCLCCCSSNNNLVQLVTNSTHVHGNILDIVLTNSPNRLSNVCIDSLNHSSSDHFLVSMSLNSLSKQNSSSCHKFTFMYNRADFYAMNEYLLENLVVPPAISSVEDLWLFIKCQILQARDLFVPKFKIPVKHHPKWFDFAVRHKLNCTRTFRMKCRKQPTFSNQQKLLVLENELQNAILVAKEQYVDSISREFRENYTVTFDLLQLPKADLTFFIINNNPLYDPKQIANAFNQFFHSTFSAPSDFLLPDMSALPTPSSQLSSVEITRSDVFTALSKLDESKAYGCDQIHPKILKNCLLSVLESVHSLFVSSLMNNTLPAEWKVHKITPIPTKGNLLEITNYRPISLLCILSKVLESIVFHKIIDFIRPNLSEYQFGFIKNKSCLTQLLSAFSIIHEAVDNKKQLDMVYLDFRKAFDSVSHNELLYKLWKMGITGICGLGSKLIFKTAHTLSHLRRFHRIHSQ